MSAPAQHAADEAAAMPPGAGTRPKRRGRKLAAVTGVVVIAAGGTVAGILTSFRGRPAAPAAAAGATSLASVTRQSISSQATVNGTMGYAGSYTVVVPAASGQPSGSDGSGQAGGGSAGAGASSGGTAETFTALPAVGHVVRQGRSLYSVNGSPVTLLYGSVPAYRSLSEGMSGTDVRQLNAALVARDTQRPGGEPSPRHLGSPTASDGTSRKLTANSQNRQISAKVVMRPSEARAARWSSRRSRGESPHSGAGPCS